MYDFRIHLIMTAALKSRNAAAENILYIRQADEQICAELELFAPSEICTMAV